jgi:transposase
VPPGMRAYSMDLRERIVAAVDAGASQSQVAERFEVSLRTVERFLARRRATGNLAPTEQRHGPEPTVRRQLHAWLPARLKAAADATLAEHVMAFVADGGQPVSLSATSRAIAGLPPEPGAALTPGGRRRRAGRPMKQKPERHRARRDRARSGGPG